SPAPTVSPSKVQLEVLNGSGAAGIATTAATSLANLGFNVIGTGDAPNGFTYTDSVIEYGSATQLPAVNTLKKELAGVQVKQVSTLEAGTLSLILGSKFTGVSGGQRASKPSAATLNSNNFQGISANQNICKDSAAFDGPNSPVPASGWPGTSSRRPPGGRGAAAGTRPGGRSSPVWPRRVPAARAARPTRPAPRPDPR